MQFHLRTLLIAVGVLWHLSGCSRRPPPSPSPPPPQVTPLDHRVAAESADFLEKTLSSLPQSHDFVRFYGRFVSMKATPFEKKPAYGPALGPGGTPSCLVFKCLCTCERFPAIVSVMVFKGNAGTDVAMSQLFLEPSQETVTSDRFSDLKPTLKENELWFVRDGSDQLQLRCTVNCHIRHPDFVGE
jgi:hypothetical protein